MYIKIKNPARYALIKQLGVLCFLLAVILIAVIMLISATGSIAILQEQSLEFFNYVKQEKGIAMAAFCVIGLLMIPIGVIAGFVEFWQKRTQWNDPSAVYALDFGPDGATAYTQQNTHFFPYEETDMQIVGGLVTVRTKNGSHAALQDLTFIFQSKDNQIRIMHQLTTAKLLYQLADLHAHFKTFAFDCNPSSSYDTDQQKLAAFLKEQMQNQMCYGLHRRYRSYFLMTFCSLLFVALGGAALFMAFAFGNPFTGFAGWILLLQGVGLVTGGIALLYNVIKDQRTASMLKRLRGK